MQVKRRQTQNIGMKEGKQVDDRIKGIIVPMFTPLGPDEAVNVQELRTLIGHLIGNGTDVLFPLGTSGEFARLEKSQKEIVLRVTVETAAGRIPVVAGVSDCGTMLVLENVGCAEETGCDAVVSTLPFYFPMDSEEEQAQFYETIAARSRLPVIIYNIPATVGASISLNVVRRLSVHGNILGIKDSSGDKRYLDALLEIKKENPAFKVFAGIENYSAEYFSKGIDGCVPSFGNVVPKLFARMYELSCRGDHQGAEDIQGQLLALKAMIADNERWLFEMQYKKMALEFMGICSGRMTMPCTPLSAETLGQVRDMTEKAKEFCHKCQ
jgi:dihydrodipicolinate synthase/N-acetylneuraminate lyase